MTDVDAALRLEGLEAWYGRARVLFGVDLVLARGTVKVLLGRNGAGKTSTLKAVAGIMPRIAGRVLVDGRDVAGQSPHRIARAGIGLVPETRRIFRGLSVRENLAVGRRAAPSGGGWDEARIFALFPALEPLAARRGGQLSGGEQQMLAIGRTLMGNPWLVLLDEPAEGLAPIVVNQMAGAIRALRDAGTTVLLAEQNLAFAGRVADGAAFIERGRIVYDGPLAGLEGRADLAGPLAPA